MTTPICLSLQEITQDHSDEGPPAANDNEDGDTHTISQGGVIEDTAGEEHGHDGEPAEKRDLTWLEEGWTGD